jgi:ATP-dependent helicase/nuclease subunit B
VTETKYPLDPPEAISGIVKSDTAGTGNRTLAAFSYGVDHPAMVLWARAQSGALDRIAAAMRDAGAHPARTLVVLPYAQLLPLVSRLWAQRFPDGFVPRFETTMNWSAALRARSVQSTDISFDMALDLLTAQSLLASAGLGAQEDALAGLLVQSAQQLAPLAAACHPDDRQAWAQTARVAAVVGMEAPALQLEAAVARVAVEWAAVSGYASDVLFDPALCGDVDLLIFVQGLNPDPLVAGLKATWGERLHQLNLVSEASEAADDVLAVAQPVWRLHPCLDGEDEAQRTAACALQHIAQGEYPLALVSSDRALTRRVRSMLEAQGVRMRDETGWKLSTSAAAAQVMALLKSGAWNTSTDSVLAWLKQVPAREDICDALEVALRRHAVRDWRAVAGVAAIQEKPPLLSLCQEVDAWIAICKGRRRLVDWIAILQTGLQTWGCWDPLLADGPGAKVAAVLRLEPASAADWNNRAHIALWSGRKLDLAEFTAWANQALEAASFQPDYPDEEQVVILPMSQMLGRPFAAVLLAGCDEVRLNPSVEPPGAWTSAQRAALGLPTRDVLEVAFRAAWHHALLTPLADVLWRTSDDTGEALMPSVLVQVLQWESHAASGADPRAERTVQPAPTQHPMPVGQLLPLERWTASAYEDLRQCPYRFFALRQLGLKSVDELEGDVDKRDFGVWLHDVLRAFHEALLAEPSMPVAQRRTLLDHCSADVTTAMGLPEGEFLPFAAAWPAVRDGYLRWLTDHEAGQARFADAETSHTQSIGSVTLFGRIDRTDHIHQGPDGQVLVVDYKTEPLAKTRGRVKEPLEDTQMAFYAALLPHDTLRGMYVNVGEKDGTKSCEQLHLVEARDALIEGLLQDVDAIAGGAALPALGEGVACDFCDARGLCRKDFWND